MPVTSNPPLKRRIVALLAVTGLVATTAACGRFTDDDATPPTPTTIVAPRLVEAAQLDAILPQAADVGSEFTVGSLDALNETDAPDEPDDEFDTAFDAAVDEECPEAERIMDGPADRVQGPRSAGRAFVAPDGRAFEIGVSSQDGNVFSAADRAELEEAVRVIGLCPTASFSAGNGMDVTITFDGTMVDTLGEWGADFGMRMIMSHPNLLQPVVMNVGVLYFGIGSVTAAVFTADGMNPDTSTLAPMDQARQDAVAGNVAMLAAALQMDAPAEAPTEAPAGP